MGFKNISCKFTEKDSANFSALPGGYSDGSSFDNVGDNGFWWSATENDTNNAWNRNMNSGNANVNRNNNNKSNLHSVRCVQDCYGKPARASHLFKELHQAYLDARRNKRNTINQLKFERNLEVELLLLCNELENRTYDLLPGICFINEKPVKREIIAADFRDRVIHHFLYNRIYSILDKKFIYDSYGCRVGRGTLFGINRVYNFARKCGKDAWVLKLDIQGFFMAINRHILHDLLIKYLSAKPNELTNYLIEKTVFNNPLKNALFKSPKSSWVGLPLDKSLITSKPNCGLPIGNLTSQIFANVYLNPLDHFIKRELKINCYGRYVDDMVLINNDKEILLNCINRIREFMQENLKLTLHPKKIKLQRANKGFAFLGAYIYPTGITAGKRLIKNFKECLFGGDDNHELQRQRVQSYLSQIDFSKKSV